MLELRGLSFQSLHISSNHLTFARVGAFVLEDVMQLFQHASQMTYCHILVPRYGARNFSMPPIIHQRLKTLGLSSVRDCRAAEMLLDSLTLPCLQEFHTDEMGHLRPASLPTLVHRSSCPLTRITLLGNELGFLRDFQPLPG
jgi:hypothetical protein